MSKLVITFSKDIPHTPNGDATADGAEGDHDYDNMEGILADTKVDTPAFSVVSS